MKRLLLASAALGIYASCGGACTLQGVKCGVQVTVVAAGGGRFPDGLYALRVHGDTLDMTASCPFRNGEPSEPCGVGEWIVPGWYLDVTGAQVRYTFNGPLGNVPSLAYELSRDGTRLQQGEIPLTHMVSEPWGSGCGQCRNSYGDLVF